MLKGIDVSKAENARQAMEMAGYTWTGEKIPLYAHFPSGNHILVDNKYAVGKMDDESVLGIVGNDYTVYQPEKQFMLFDQLVQEGVIKYYKVFSIDSMVGVMYSVPEEIRIGSQDKVDPYVAIFQGFDGKTGLNGGSCQTRPICKNTFMMAMKEAGRSGFRLRHFDNIEEKAEESAKSVYEIIRGFKPMGEAIRAMAGKKLTFQQAGDAFRMIWPTRIGQKINTDGAALLESILSDKQEKNELMAELLSGDKVVTQRMATRNNNILEQILNNYELYENNLPGAESSVWTWFNSISRFENHQVMKRKNGDENERILVGTGAKIMNQAWNMAVNMIK